MKQKGDLSACGHDCSFEIVDETRGHRLRIEFLAVSLADRINFNFYGPSRLWCLATQCTRKTFNGDLGAYRGTNPMTLCKGYTDKSWCYLSVLVVSVEL